MAIIKVLWGTLQNQILPCIGPSNVRYSHFSASTSQSYQENALDITVDNLVSLVSIYAERECIAKTLHAPPSSGDALTRVLHEFALQKNE